jgi:hypothetical protein
MSADVLEKVVAPELRSGKSVLMAVLSGMRMDQFIAVEPELKKSFSVSRTRFMSALPTTSDFCMAALAFGGHSDAAFELEPAAFEPAGGACDSGAMKRLMRGGLERAGLGGEKIKTFYASADGAGGKRHIKSAVDAMKKVQAFGIVTTDIIGKFMNAGPSGRPNAGRQSKETAPDNDAAFRRQVESWFAASEILGMLKEACGESCTAVLTSDHGHVSCGRASEVYETPDVGGAPRHLFCDRISIDEREAFLLEELAHFRLPPRASGTKCAMARENYDFTHPGKPDGARGRGRRAGNFQSGGISLEEMVMPLYVCRPLAGLGGEGG